MKILSKKQDCLNDLRNRKVCVFCNEFSKSFKNTVKQDKQRKTEGLPRLLTPGVPCTEGCPPTDELNQEVSHQRIRFVDLHTSAYDDANATAIYFATFTGSHVGDGGPVPPTGKETNAHYVYVLKMNGDEKVVSMQKVWNAPWTMNELGWI